MTEPRLDQRKSHTGINGFTPTEPEAFDEHAGDLGHIGVGVGIRRTAPHHDKQGFLQGHIAWRLIQGFTNPSTRRADHQPINAQLAAVVDG